MTNGNERPARDGGLQRHRPALLGRLGVPANDPERPRVEAGSLLRRRAISHGQGIPDRVEAAGAAEAPTAKPQKQFGDH